MFKRVLELKFFSRTISNDEKVEKEIEIQREAVQLTDRAGQKFEGNPNSNCCVRVRESKIKSFRKVAQWVKFSTILPLHSAVKSLLQYIGAIKKLPYRTVFLTYLQARCKVPR